MIKSERFTAHTFLLLETVEHIFVMICPFPIPRTILFQQLNCPVLCKNQLCEHRLKFYLLESWKPAAWPGRISFFAYSNFCSIQGGAWGKWKRLYCIYHFGVEPSRIRSSADSLMEILRVIIWRTLRASCNEGFVSSSWPLPILCPLGFLAISSTLLFYIISPPPLWSAWVKCPSSDFRLILPSLWEKCTLEQ